MDKRKSKYIILGEKMKKKNPEEKKIKIVICLTREEIKILDSIAADNKRSRSGQIAEWIYNYFGIKEIEK